MENSKQNRPTQNADHKLTRELNQQKAPSREPVDPGKTTPDLTQETAATVPRVLQDGNEVKFGPLCKAPRQDADLLMKAVGTDDSDFLHGTVIQLSYLCLRDGVVDRTQLDFMLSIVMGIKPRDQIEAMLATQMAAVQALMLKFSSELAEAPTPQQVDNLGGMITKLARTFTTQMDTLQRHRSAGEQKVTVQNVSVSEGGQAIVGNVTQTARSDNRAKDAASPAAITDARTAPMPVIEEREHVAVPVKRRAGKK
jgi:hypothetical protein